MTESLVPLIYTIRRRLSDGGVDRKGQRRMRNSKKNLIRSKGEKAGLENWWMRYDCHWT